MWVLINEVIIFGIMLSLIIGYFGGRDLGINKEVQFKSVVNSTVNKIKKDLSTGVSYKIERLVSSQGNQNYIEYKIKLTHKRDGTKLTKQEINKIVNSITNNCINNVNSGGEYNWTNSQVNLEGYKSLIPLYDWDNTIIKDMDKLPQKSTIFINSPVPGGYYENSLFYKKYGRKFTKEDVNSVNINDLNGFEKQLYYAWKKDNKVIVYIAANGGNATFTGNKSDPNRDRTLSDGTTKVINIKEKIDKILEQYNVDGFFIDEVDWSVNPGLYKKIYKYVKSINKNMIVAVNAGYSTTSETMEYSDIDVMIENDYNSIKIWEEKYRDYITKYPEYKNAVIGSNFPNNEAIDNVFNHYKNVDLDNNQSTHILLYLTKDGVDGNPRDSLDLYFINKIQSEY